MKKYTVLIVGINKPGEEFNNIPSFLNAEGASVIPVNSQDSVSKEYLQAGVIVFVDLEQAKKLKDKLTSENQYPEAVKFYVAEIEMVYSSLWKNAKGETEGKFHGYRILGEIE